MSQNVLEGLYNVSPVSFHLTNMSIQSRVVLQPSSKTDYVVLGDNAGPSKIAAIKKHGINTLNEDEFLNLIATRKGLGNGKIDEKTKKKMEKEKEEIRKAAKEMEKRDGARLYEYRKDRRSFHRIHTAVDCSIRTPKSERDLRQ